MQYISRIESDGSDGSGRGKPKKGEGLNLLSPNRNAANIMPTSDISSDNAGCK